MDSLRDISAFIIDIDGVLYRGHQVLPGAREFIAFLRKRETPFLLLTNNSTRTPAQYVARLKGMGIPVEEEHIFTSAQATASWLRGIAKPGSRVYLIGMDGIREALLSAGFVISDDSAVDFVVVGMDTTVTYEKLKKATLAIRAGARFIGTNPDRSFPSEEGIIPGNGAILAAIEAATDLKPTVIGKPERAIFDAALEKLGSRREETAVIGDRLDTDILGGRRAGLKTILVLSGITDRETLARSPVKPDWVFESLQELLSRLKG